MRKLIAIFAIATTLVACGGGVSNNPTTDSTAVKTDSVTVDSTTVSTDTTTAVKVEEVK
jgi:ABC-type glycerol-3-phosphate transport system substrate-binding protein